MKKIGIMGGTFDPIHIGHLILGESAYDQLGLDRVVYMPAGNPPHKREREGRASNEERLEFVRRAISGNPHFEVSDREMRQEGLSFTYRTLEGLCAEHPDEEYYFIIGADSLFDFDDWREPQRIADHCVLVAATRDHASREDLHRRIEELKERYSARIVLLDTENIDISSHEIRSWITEGRSVRYYVPDNVISYIEENGIYR